MHTHHSHHDHACHTGTALWRLGIALGLSTGYMVLEALGGYLSGSLTLMADAGHMLIHNGALVIALVATWVAARQPDDTYAAGYGRIEAVGGFFNAILLIAVALILAGHGVERLHDHHSGHGHTHVIDTSLMGLVAFTGLLVHGVSAVILYRGRRESLNVYAAFLHMLVDVAATLLALGTSLLIHHTGFDWLDAASSLLIVLLILLAAGNLLRQTFYLLMDRTPAHLSLPEIKTALKTLPHVHSVHHVHIRALRPGVWHMSAHLVLESACMEAEHWLACRKQAQDMLRTRFGITQTLLQVEPAPHDHAE
jgi:cobalt-zinc-cadmium efflux system protein